VWGPSDYSLKYVDATDGADPVRDPYATTRNVGNGRFLVLKTKVPVNGGTQDMWVSVSQILSSFGQVRLPKLQDGFPIIQGIFNLPLGVGQPQPFLPSPRPRIGPVVSADINQRCFNCLPGYGVQNGTVASQVIAGKRRLRQASTSPLVYGTCTLCPPATTSPGGVNAVCTPCPSDSVSGHVAMPGSTTCERCSPFSGNPTFPNADRTRCGKCRLQQQGKHGCL